MAVYKNVLVDMPSKGVIINIHNPKKIPYVYYATKYYRNENGKSITVRKCIGKKDIESGKLIPNNNYYDLFKNDDVNIALIAFLRIVLNPYFKESEFTITEVINELMSLNINDSYLLSEPLSEKQKNILNHFNIDVDDFIKSIKELYS